MWIRDTIKSVWEWIKNAGQYVVSEFLTNKDMSKWILDFDKFQEYNKLIEAPWVDSNEIKEIQGRMASEGIIDPYLFGNYMIKSAEATAKAEAKVSPVDKQVGQSVYDLRNSMSNDLAEDYKKWDKYQREVIAKAIDELTAQYQYQADNVLKVYEDTKSPELIKQRNELRPEYEQLIRDSAKKYAQYINEWLDFNEAYKKLIKEWRDKADRIIEIQTKLQNTMNWKAWVVWNFKEAASHLKWDWTNWSLLDELWNVPKWMFDLGKGLMNIMNWVEWIIWQWIEKTFNYFWKYDTLEELSHMNIYRDSAPILDQYRTLKNRWWEILDALPQLIPAVAWLVFGNKWAQAIKLDQAMTTLLRGGKFIEGASDISKMWKFVSEWLQDLMWMDMVAQPLIGRPMTTKDFQENRMFNLPINAFLGSMVRWGKLIQWLPDGALSPKYISPDVLSLIEDWSHTDDEVVKYWFAQNKTRKTSQLDDIISDMPDIETWLTTNKKAKKNIDSMQDTIDIRQLPLEQQQRIYDSLLPWLVKHNEAIKQWKITLTDVALNDTLTKTVKTDAKNLSLWSKEQINIPKEAINRADTLVLNSLNASPKRLREAKQTQIGLLNLYRAWDISKESITSIIDWATPGLWQDMLKSIWLWDKEARARVVEIMKDTSNKVNDIQSIEDAYNDVLEWIISLWETKWWLKPGTQIWAYTFLWNGKRYWIEWGQELTKEDLFKKVDIQIGKKRILETTSIARSDYFNYSVWQELKAWIEAANGWPVDISNILRLDNKWITNYLNDYSWAKTRLQWIYKQLNIQFNATYTNWMVKNLTTTNKAAVKLLEIIDSMKAKWFNITQLSKKEIAMYKLIHVKEYLDAMKTSWQKQWEFKAWFEKLYKEEDWIFKLDLEKFRISSDEFKNIAEQSAKHNFVATEILSAQVYTESILKKITELTSSPVNELDEITWDLSKLKTEIESNLSWDLMNTSIYQAVEDSIVWAVQHIKTTWEEKQVFLKAYWKSIGWILWDRQSRRYLEVFLRNTDDETKWNIIKSLIARSMSKDEVVRSLMLKNISEQMKAVKNPAMHKWLYELISSMDALTDKGWFNFTDSLPSEMKASLMMQLNMLIKNQISFFYPEHSVELFDNQYKRLKASPFIKSIEWKDNIDLLKLSNRNILSIAQYKAYEALDRYWIKNPEMAKLITNGTYKLIKWFQDKILKVIPAEADIINWVEQSQIKALLRFDWSRISTMRWDDRIGLNIENYSDYQLLEMMWDVDQWFNHIAIHEMAHLEQRLWWIDNALKNWRELSATLSKQYNELTEMLRFWGRYSNDLLKESTSYFRDFDAALSKTTLNQTKVNEMIDEVIDAMNKWELHLNTLTDKLTNLYKIYNWLNAVSPDWFSNIDILHIAKETMAEWLYQAKMELSIWLSKEEFAKVKDVLDSADEILNRIEYIFNDIGKKYSTTQIQQMLSGKLSSLIDSITGESIKKEQPVYLDGTSNTVNQWFLWAHYNKVSNNISDNAIKIRRKVYDNAKSIYSKTKTPETISLTWLEKVVRRAIWWYSIPTMDALAIILWKNNQAFDINMLHLSGKDIDAFDNLYKWQYTYKDEYIMNKIIANVLSSKGMYSKEKVDWLNKMVYPERLNLELSNLRNNEIIFTRTLHNALTDVWQNMEWVTVFDIKKIIWWKSEYKDLMNSLHNYMFNKFFAWVSDKKTLSDSLYTLRKQLNPLLERVKNLDIVTEETKYLKEDMKWYWFHIDDSLDTLVDDIVDKMYNQVVNNNWLFVRDQWLVSKPNNIIGKWKGFEFNSLLYFEWLHEKKKLSIAEVKKLVWYDKHTEAVFNWYSLKRNNIKDRYTFLKRKWLDEAWKAEVIKEPLEIIFKWDDGFKKTITINPWDNKANELIKTYLTLLENDGETKVILLKSDEIGGKTLLNWDTNYQLLKFWNTPVWLHILKQLDISKNTETVIPEWFIKAIDPAIYKKIQNIQKARALNKMEPLTEQEIKSFVSKISGEESYLEIPFSRPKTPLEILDEIKDYYNKKTGFIDIKQWDTLRFLSKSQKESKYLLSKINNILKETTYTSKQYIEWILDSKLLLGWKEVNDSFKLVWVRVPYKLIWKQPSISKWLKMDEDIIMEGEYIAQWLSKSFISDEKLLLKAKWDFIDNVYKTIWENYPDTDKYIINMVESWDTIAKVDYDNDIFQAVFIKWWVDEEKKTVYWLIQRKSNWVYEILPDSIKDAAYKFDANDAAVKYESKIPRAKNISKIDAKFFDWLVKTADDDFKC